MDRRRNGIRSDSERLHNHVLTRKRRRAALKSALTSRVNENKFVVVDELKFDEIKTKNFKAVMNNLKVSKALVVLADNDQNTVLSPQETSRKLRLPWLTQSMYIDILKYNTVVATKAAVEIIEEVYA